MCNLPENDPGDGGPPLTRRRHGRQGELVQVDAVASVSPPPPGSLDLVKLDLEDVDDDALPASDDDAGYTRDQTLQLYKWGSLTLFLPRIVSNSTSNTCEQHLS